MYEFIDLTNKTCGRWRVVERGPNDSSGSARFWCICADCGEKHLILSKSLRKKPPVQCRDCKPAKLQIDLALARKLWQEMSLAKVAESLGCTKRRLEILLRKELTV